MDRKKGNMGQNRVIEFLYPPCSIYCKEWTTPHPVDGIIAPIDVFISKDRTRDPVPGISSSSTGESSEQSVYRRT